MDYLPRTLSHVLAERGRLGERAAAHIIARILASVAYLHGENIVHRDLKPDNVAICPSSRCRSCRRRRARCWGVCG